MAKKTAAKRSSSAEAKYVRLARERQERDLERARSHDSSFPYYWDPAAAERVVQFFERYLRHHKGRQWAKKPFLLSPWQKDILEAVFGWRRHSDGTRRFRTSYVEVAKKNGKTETAAGVGLFMLVADGEPGGEIYSAATKKDQAKICHDAAKAMVKLSPQLRQWVRPFRNNLHCERLGSKFEPLGADSDTMDGLGPHGAILDEMHAQKNRGVRDTLVTGMAARMQPLLFEITTAGLYDPTKIGWIEHEYAIKVLDEVFADETFYAFIASAEKDDDITDPATWAKANPNLDVSVSRDYLKERAEQAQRETSHLNAFWRFNLDVWTEQIDRWIPPEAWKACPAGKTEHQLRGRECYAGIDLSSTQDLTALALVFPPGPGEKTVSTVRRFWVPESTIVERTKRDRVPYDTWVRDGWIRKTTGNVIDYDFIRAELNRLKEKFNILEVGYDPFNATKLVQDLQDKDGFVVVPVRQGYLTLNEPSKEFEKLVASRRLGHGDDPVLGWNVSNAAIDMDAAGNIKPSKEKSREKIDGVTAVIVALDRMIRHDGGEMSMYATEEVLVI